MIGERVERRLAAILAADVVGYSRLMGQDEAGTLARLRDHRRELIDPEIAEHKGRVVKTTGDGILIEFPSVVEAVACAVAVQSGMAERNEGTPKEQRIVFRVGVNLGDIIIAEDNDIHGDGVNVAARLEGISEPGGVCVSGIVHDQVRDKLNLVFDDLGDQALKNIARPLRVYRVRQGGDERAPSASLVETTPTLALPDKPSIAVLPFQNMSGDPEQEYFADGMIEEIITALSRIRWLFVIAHNSALTYKGQKADVKEVGHELGVRYVLEGSIRKGGGRVRITAQLIEAETGTHLWADRFDGSLEEVFDLQDRVATSVAGVIEPALQAAETARSARPPTVDLTAYDLYLRATALFYSSSRLVPAALCLTEQAIARDPDYSNALALAALCYHRLLLDSTSQDRAADRKTGTELARRALQGPGDDPVTLSHAGFALGYFGEDINAMIAVVDRALSLNPCYARGWFHAGVLRMWSGQPDAAIEHVETSLRLSPRANIGVCNHVIGASHLLARRFDEALPKLVVAANEDPSFPNAHRYLASCYAHMGRLREASDVIRHLRTITPTVMPDASYLRHKEHRELLLSGLRLAAGETE